MCRLKKRWPKVCIAVGLGLGLYVLVFAPSVDWRHWGWRSTRVSCLETYLKEREISSMGFYPPSTLQTALDYFEVQGKSGVGLERPLEILVQSKDEACKTRPLPIIVAQEISFYDAIKLVADRAGFEMEIRDHQVVLKERKP